MINNEYEKIMNGIIKSYNIAGKNYYELFHNELIEHQVDQELLKDFIASFKFKPIICDIGCGPAVQYGAFIKPFCKELHAIDISENNIKLAKQDHNDIIFFCEDMINTHYKNNILDGIICFYSLFHIPKNKMKNVFKEFYRILKRSGKILLVTHKGNLKKIFSDLWGNTGLSLFANFHNENEIEKVMMEVGFKSINVTSKKAYYEFPKERIIAIGTK